MTNKIKGIILSSSTYRDNDLMVKCLNKEYGILTFIAKGAKKLNSKNAMALLPYSISDIYFDYKENKELFSLIKAERIETFYKEDIEVLAALALISKAAIDAYNQYDYKDLYDLVYEAYRASKSYNLITTVSLYLTELSKLLGFKAMVDGCVKCLNTKVVSFSIKDGGFLCLEHLGDNKLMDVFRLKKLRLIFKADFRFIDEVEKIKLDKEDLRMVAHYFYSHSDFDEKPYTFFIKVLD